MMNFYQLNLIQKFDKTEIESDGKFSWITYDSIWVNDHSSVFIHYQKSNSLNEEALHFLIRKIEKNKVVNYSYIIEKDNHDRLIYNEEVHEKENNFILESIDDTLVDINTFENENQFFEKIKKIILL